MMYNSIKTGLAGKLQILSVFLSPSHLVRCSKTKSHPPYIFFDRFIMQFVERVRESEAFFVYVAFDVFKHR